MTVPRLERQVAGGTVQIRHPVDPLFGWQVTEGPLPRLLQGGTASTVSIGGVPGGHNSARSARLVLLPDLWVRNRRYLPQFPKRLRGPVSGLTESDEGRPQHARRRELDRGTSAYAGIGSRYTVGRGLGNGGLRPVRKRSSVSPPQRQ
jgi:hypothetical protein